MARIKIYSTGTCPLCERAKQLLTKYQIAYDEVRVDLDRAGLKEMLEVAHHARTVPQILIDGRPIGGFADGIEARAAGHGWPVCGFTELTELHMDGGLDELMPAGR